MQINKNSHIAAYIQVKDGIKNYIIKNNLKAGDPIPKLREICEQAQVSLRTAQKAVNELTQSGECKKIGRRIVISGQEVINCENNHDIFAICDHLGRTTFHMDYIQNQIVQAIRNEINARDRSEIVFLNTPPGKSIDFFYKQFAYHLKGIILLHWQDSDKLRILAEKFPNVKFVQVNYQLKDFNNLPTNVYGIFNDDYSGGYQVADYFATSGIKKPLFIELNISDSTYEIRRSGFLAGLEENNLKGKVLSIPDNCNLPFNAKIRDFTNRFADFFKRNNDIDAILCSNDILAEGTGSFLEQHDLLDKIKLVGYDDFIGMGHSRFSSVAVNYSNMGQRAFQLLVNPDKKPKIQNLPPQLMIRHAYLKQEI